MSHPTILIADDEPANLTVLSQLLSPTYRVRACKSGEQALEVARREPRPDLIMLDVMMPGMDGYAVLAKLREDEQTRDIPIIFVSGMADDLDEEKGLRLGAVDHITKPIKPTVVLARVGAHVAIKQARDQLTREIEERKKAQEALRWVEAHGVPTFEGEGQNRLASSLVGTVRDITDRKRMEEELRHVMHELQVHQVELQAQNEDLRQAQDKLAETLDRFADLYDFAPVGYLTMNAVGLIIQANLTLARLLGVARRALLKQPFSRFVCKEDADTYRLHLRRVIEAQSENACEVRLAVGGDNILHAGLRFLPIVDDSGSLIELRVVVSDITEHKKAEELRQQLELQRQQIAKAESLGRMAGAIAHHFNNLLGVVLGNLELTALCLEPESETREYIDQAMVASGRAADISRSMLAYLGQTVGVRAPVGLSGICREAMSVLTESLDEKVHLKVVLPEEDPLIRGNAAAIGQVLTNLVANAGEAIGGRTGEITVEVSIEAGADIGTLRFHPPEWLPEAAQYACLTVSDTGIGMDAESLEKAFDPFFSSKFTGRGLGLPVVLGIVKAHDGAITVGSTPGGGSSFRVFLPLLVRERQLREKGKPVDHLPRRERGLVLVVEDEPLLCKMAKGQLEHLGYQAITAVDGAEAVEVFRMHQGEIQCVLLDLTLPNMGGWETLAELRALRSDLPVILSSGFDEARAMTGDHAEQPQAFLAKPYRGKDLEAALEKALQMR